jgi:hypothetical protein
MTSGSRLEKVGLLRSLEASTVFGPILESSRLPLTVLRALHGSGVNDAQAQCGAIHDKIGTRNVPLQAHGIINVALHREYSPGIVFYFPKGGRISIVSKTNTGSNSNVYY